MQSMLDKIQSGQLNNFEKTDFYKLDSYFKSVEDLSILKGRKIKNNYPLLNEMIKAYRNKLEGLYEEYKNDMLNSILVMDPRQMYETKVDINEEGDYFNIIMDTNKLNKIIKHSMVKVDIQEITLNELVSSIDVNTLDEKYFKVASRNNNPIFVGYTPHLENKYIVFDGNHRAYSKYKQGQNSILAYVFHPGHYAECTISDIYRYLIYMHLNIWIVCNYMIGNWGTLQLALLINENY
ncbi:hypothetical protein OD350_24755 [Clostridium beijerinckii]|uniref:ParB/Sulfiredoxin domain-containing protein n=1 Tax=Clostridium beijerinckii TaxID=1520 RepID=A0AAX0B6H6_CLOBE|nr:hypothetical protein [Clostridium beijerinckii]NRT90213.1 hypothetical protein [Clostridium beijerinckii]NYC69743.1 hypothetical protein [Clostridium beijerinckii]UYZ35382.1 hypothetical protein OD350_24755 [Clostridium beijerinckii]